MVLRMRHHPADSTDAGPAAPGPIEWRLVSDGEAAYPRDVVFANAERRELDAAGIGDEVVTPYRALLVRAAGRLILVDAGLGALATHMGGTAGRLLQALAAEGVLPGQIDDVVITH